MAIVPSKSDAQKTIARSGDNINENWNAVKVSESTTNSNLIQGVAFYKKAMVCNSDTVILLKLLNINKYQVKVEWQDTNGLTQTFYISAKSHIYGTCEGNSDGTANNNLVFSKSKVSKEFKDLMLKTLTVTKIDDQTNPE